ncbi:unnamed protein product [Adineta ricciae]|uniref:Uncharacterized protein n=1 Tax=Adineta ricciae TaxID=249248 RepID=A0A814SWV5_ADIRI|nr:unnamed protein product [Adineta ricciae]
MTTSSVCSTTIERYRNPENYAIIWLDADFSDQNGIHKSGLEQLENLAGRIETFTESNECIDFITHELDTKLLLIVSDSFGAQLISILDDMPQIQSVYIFSTNSEPCVSWTKDYSKVRGIYKDIVSLCQIIKRDIRIIEYNLTPISIYLSRFSTNDQNTLDPTFMYCQILKEIFLDMEYGKEAKQNLVELCRKEYATSIVGLRVIAEFERDYDKHTPVWWYTRDCFVYRMLNKALRTHHIEVINKFAFFIKDLHRQLEQLQGDLGMDVSLDLIGLKEQTIQIWFIRKSNVHKN